MFGCWGRRGPECPAATPGQVGVGREAAMLSGLVGTPPHAGRAKCLNLCEARSILICHRNRQHSAGSQARKAWLRASLYATLAGPLLLLALPPCLTGQVCSSRCSLRRTPSRKPTCLPPSAPGAPSGPAQPADYRMHDLQAHKPVCGPPGNQPQSPLPPPLAHCLQPRSASFAGRRASYLLAPVEHMLPAA